MCVLCSYVIPYFVDANGYFSWLSTIAFAPLSLALSPSFLVPVRKAVDETLVLLLFIAKTKQKNEVHYSLSRSRHLVKIAGYFPFDFRPIFNHYE